MPERVKISANALPDLVCPPDKPDQTFWDTELKGFGVRAYPTGRRVWIAQYRDKAGKQGKVTLGDVQKLKPDQARVQAKKVLANVQLGGNPGVELQARRDADRLIDLINAYLPKAKAKLKPRSYVEVERALLRSAKALHHSKADAITQRQIADLVERIAVGDPARSVAARPVWANRVRAHLSALWTWAMRAGRVSQANPVARTALAAKEQPRDRVLSDDEIALIWRCTGTGHDYDRIVRLLLLTAARRDEVGSMAPGEVQECAGGGRLWTLPAARSKNHLPHEVQLGPLALEQLPPFRDNYPFVFGSSAAPKTGFAGWSKSKERLDERIRAALAKDFEDQHGRPPREGEAQLTKWRLHDLRRTFSTWANDNEIEPHVVEAVLNHVSGAARRGVAGTYNRATYRDAKRAALAKWERRVRDICHLSNDK
jgi:integrase